MPKFKDSHDREWQVSLDGITLKELRDTHKIDLSDVVGSVYAQLKRDPALLIVALAHICQDQIAKAELTTKKFAQGINGVVIEDAFAALWRAAELFFPPSLWSALSARCKQEEEMEVGWAQIKPMMSLLSQPEVPSEVREQVWVMISKMLPTDLSALKEMSSATGQESTLLNVVTNSLDSAASIPAA